MTGHNSSDRLNRIAIVVVIILGCLMFWGLHRTVIEAQNERIAKQRNEHIAKQRDERVAMQRAEALAAMPASEHLKAGELALASRRSNDTRPPLVLTGQKAQKPVITDAQWDSTRKRLNLIREDQPEYPKAQQLLKAMTASDKQKAIKDARDEEILAAKTRKSYAVQLEERLVEKRINADVKTFGKESTTLWIKWVLASKVTANDLSKSGILEEAERLGFKKVEFTDGYDLTWRWKL